jgi:hypothetical protein
MVLAVTVAIAVLAVEVAAIVVVVLAGKEK